MQAIRSLIARFVATAKPEVAPVGQPQPLSPLEQSQVAGGLPYEGWSSAVTGTAALSSGS